MNSNLTIHSPTQQLQHPLFDECRVTVYVKRDDLIHPIISGNKWRKLKYNLKQAKRDGYKGVLSFGGAYSNHIHALAFACQQEGLSAVGIIRGEKHYANNATLKQAQNWGMKLIFVDRQTYRQRENPDFIHSLLLQYPEHYFVPEGGTNDKALRGVAELCDELSQQVAFDTLITPVGSAGTLSGLVLGDKSQHQLLGIAVLKQANYLNDRIKQLLATQNNTNTNWQLLTDYHCGGYAKFTSQDLIAMQQFSQQTMLPIEPIYSGKMCLALMQLLTQGYFAAGEKIVLLHTGGLQGLYGLIEQNRIMENEWLLPLVP